MPKIHHDLRIDYRQGELLEKDASPDPIEQFDRWFSEAQLAKVPEPNAMTLATVDTAGMPSARIVLLKSFDSRGFTFFTNYGSRKGRELDANPRAAICFYWQPIERQVRIEGAVERVSRAESDEYFHTRPAAAQIGAWASAQSSVIESREYLEQRKADLARKYAGGEVPLPDFWGGYRVIPSVIEFWQGRPSRLHDRLRYTRQGEKWKIDRLSP